MRREYILNENEILDQDTIEIEWPERLEYEMSEYDTYMLLLGDEELNAEYFSTYCSIQPSQFHKVH